MANIYWLECGAGYFLLLLVSIGLSIVPSVSGQHCNTNYGEPVIKISSTPSSDKLPISATVNLTCTAWQTDELAMKQPKTRPQRIEWFDPNGMLVGECRAHTPVAIRMKCLLMVDALTEEKFGNYTCKASNGYYYCSTKRFPIRLQDIERPQIVVVPVSQGAVIGSNASFNCCATGYPKPTITWKKDNDSNSIQPVVETDDEKTLSQLIITKVTSKDYGKYVCVANNRAGVETSKVAVLYKVEVNKSEVAPTYPGTEVEVNKSEVAPTYPGTEAPSLSRMPQNGAYKIIAITVSGIVVAMLIVAFWWHCKHRCLCRKAHNGKDPEPSLTYNMLVQEERKTVTTLPTLRSTL